MTHDLKVKAWIDDVAVYGSSEAEYLDTVDKFLGRCKERNLFLSARKSSLFQRSLHWCGRIITADGFRVHPKRVEVIRDAHTPADAGELSQFINCVQWMSRIHPTF